VAPAEPVPPAVVSEAPVPPEPGIVGADGVRFERGATVEER
jgi:hypothetical protein